MLIDTVDRLVLTGCQQMLKLTSNHSERKKICDTLEKLRMYLKRLTVTCKKINFLGLMQFPFQKRARLFQRRRARRGPSGEDC